MATGFARTGVLNGVGLGTVGDNGRWGEEKGAVSVHEGEHAGWKMFDLCSL